MSADTAMMEKFLADLFGSDLVLPAQFHERAVPVESGIHALMWAVLTDGIETFRRTAHSRVAAEVDEFREVLTWVKATDWDSVFSFDNLCEIFGFAPAALRAALLAWKSEGNALSKRQRFRPAALRAA